MNAKILAVLFSISCFKCISSEMLAKKYYDNYSLYESIPGTADHLKFFQNLDKQKYIDVVFWQKPYKLFDDVHIIVNPKDEATFIERTHHFDVHAAKILKDMQREFDKQAEGIGLLRQNPGNYSWNYYHSLADIYQWLRDVSITHPNIMKLESIGKSVESRDILAVGFQNDRSKHSVIVEGGIHGNEWLAVEFVTFLINELVRAGTGKETYFKPLAEKYNWYLVPVLNPDGFEYNQKVDRMWKKNRKQFSNSFGVNLDRNFDYQFGKHDSSFDAKDDNFCGPSSLSEPETQYWVDFVNKHSHKLKFYFSFHTYGQKIIIPYGDSVLHQDNYDVMENYAKQAIMKIYRSSGMKYSSGTMFDLFGFKISGDSTSWVKQSHNVKYVFKIFLRDNGYYGYAIPKEQILPTCQETLTAIMELMTAKPRKIRDIEMFSSRCTSFFEKKPVSVPISIALILNYFC